ncbi:MAG: hypothetical protein PHC60_08145 [Heliobacteriaceae bacterium]|nr:hypothetical protein [Heliobacteriaceae bacterium]MDD4588343.1 hypothetical protein [Heliobacteriaceae bacterium]
MVPEMLNAQLSPEITATMLMSLIMATVEGIKILMKNNCCYKVFQVFILFAAGLFWGGAYACWQADSISWELFRQGGKIGLGIAVNAGVTYGIISGIYKKRLETANNRNEKPSQESE